jgi:L-histidine Nalpha-methyltransferase
VAVTSTRGPGAAVRLETFARDVRAGLGQPGQKRLSPVYFYDEVGSALFEAITVLPEYGLTRADERVIRRLVSELDEFTGAGAMVVELGSGSGRKTRLLLDAFPSTPRYIAVDVSAAALERCRRELEGAACISTVSATYLDGLASAAAYRRTGAGHRILVLFLGSNIGNFDPAEARTFLQNVRQCLHPGDGLLLGTDLVKQEAVLLAAYDDPCGVTAAFNLNLLARINRELGADFNLRWFRHEARFASTERRVEMHLCATRAHSASIPGADIEVSFKSGESIFTEASYKFVLEELPALAAGCGFQHQQEWVDEEWLFAESLWIAV